MNFIQINTIFKSTYFLILELYTFWIAPMFVLSNKKLKSKNTKMETKKEKLGAALLIGIALAAFTAASLQPPVSQNISYHHFTDVRSILSLSNFWNVISNIPFFIVGFLGLFKLLIQNKLKIIQENKMSYVLFFASTMLIALGSSFYHLHPNNQTLVWDRLPMTIAFMALFSIVITEFVSIKNGKTLLIPLLLAGVLSVIYWHHSELSGDENLNYYILVQFYPMVAIPLILIFFQPSFTKGNAYWWLLIAYALAKLCEHFDGQIYDALHFMSGHSIKHIIAAMGLYKLLLSYEKRQLADKMIPLRVTKFPKRDS